MLYSDSLCEMMQNAVNESFWDAHGVEIEARPKTAPKSWVVKRPWLAETLASHDGLPRLRKPQTRVGPNQGLVTSRSSAAVRMMIFGGAPAG